jgi:hypothetical protein
MSRELEDQIKKRIDFIQVIIYMGLQKLLIQVSLGESKN